MSILMEILSEELDRLNRQQAAYEADLKDCPKGYISKKNIRGKVAYYLQYRDGNKIVSKYISLDALSSVNALVERRKRLETSLRRVREDQQKLRKVLG